MSFTSNYKLYLIGHLTGFPNMPSCYLCAVQTAKYPVSKQSYALRSPHEKFTLGLFTDLQLRSFKESGMLGNSRSFDTVKKMQSLIEYDYYDFDNNNTEGVIAFVWGLEMNEKPKSRTKQGLVSYLCSKTATCFVAFYYTDKGEWEFFNTDVAEIYKLLLQERIEFANIEILESEMSEKQALKEKLYPLRTSEVKAKYPDTSLAIRGQSFILCYLPSLFTTETEIEVLPFI